MLMATGQREELVRRFVRATTERTTITVDQIRSMTYVLHVTSEELHTIWMPGIKGWLTGMQPGDRGSHCREGDT